MQSEFPGQVPVELFRTILMVTKALAGYTYKGREMVAKQEAQELLKHRSALAGEYFALADGRVSEEAQEFLALQTKILLQVVPDYKSNHRLSVCAFAGFTLEKEPLQDVILPSFPGPEPYGGEMGVTEWVQDDDPIDAICRFVSMVYLGVTPTPDILVAIAERMKRYLDGNGALSLDEAFGLKRKQRVGHPLKQRSQDERRGRIIYLMWCLRYKAKSEGKPISIEDAAQGVIERLNLPESIDVLKKEYTAMDADTMYNHAYESLKEIWAGKR